MTTSLSALLGSLVAGGFVVGAIAFALVIVSQSDRVSRS